MKTSMFLCFHVNFRHEAQKHACFHVKIFHLVLPFIPHYIIMVKGLLNLNLAHFNKYSGGSPTISEEDFARILLRHTAWDLDPVLDRLRTRLRRRRPVSDGAVVRMPPCVKQFVGASHPWYLQKGIAAILGILCSCTVYLT